MSPPTPPFFWTQVKVFMLSKVGKSHSVSPCLDLVRGVPF